MNPDDLLPRISSGRKLTEQEMNKAFKRVQNRDNWKMPIDKVIEATPEEIEVIQAAVIFYAGCMAEVVPVKGKGKKRYRVTAIGYYMAVGA